MRIKYGAQAVPGGSLIASQTDVVDLYLHEGDAVVDSSIDTDAEGFWEHTWVPTGSAGAGWVLKPGPMYWVLTYLGRVRRGSTKAGGMIGPNSLLEFPELMPIYGDHVVSGAIAGDFAVTLDGAGMDCDIAAGYAIVRGVGVDNPSARELTVTAADGSNPRIDTVVLELIRTSGDTEGKVTLKMVDGTAAASPVAPTLTQDTSTWQYPLADIRTNVGAITPTSITDRRTYPTTSIERSPTQLPTLRTAPGSTAITSTPTAIAALQHSITLVANKWYDILIEADVEVSASSGSVTTSCYIEGTSNVGSSQSITTTTVETLPNAHTRTVLGTGGAITCGVLISESGTGFYYSGISTVTAIPRS